MSDKKTTILIRGKVGYEDDITVAQAAQIIAFLDGAEGAAASLGSIPLGGATNGAQTPPPGGGGAPGTVRTAREALELSGAKTNAEKIVALGAFLLRDSAETFTPDEVKAEFRRARETVPGNFPRDLGVAIQAGWLAHGQEDNTFYVTSKIEGIFGDGFKFPKITGGKTRTSSKSGKSKAEKPEVFAALDEFPTQLSGFPSYSKMRLNKDKLLWALTFAKANGVKGLSNKDLTWLTDHLGAGVPSGQITAAFNALKGAGYANRSTQDQTIRVTPDGETYLATVGTSESGS